MILLCRSYCAGEDLAHELFFVFTAELDEHPPDFQVELLNYSAFRRKQLRQSRHLFLFPYSGKKVAALMCATKQDHSGTIPQFIRGARSEGHWHIPGLLC